MELPPELTRDASKFEPKLSFDDRCALLALHRKRASREILAAAFGINRRTINKIVSPVSPRYRDVRDREKSLGADAFAERYIKEHHIEAMRAAATKPEVTQTDREYFGQTAAARTAEGGASRRATSCEGIAPTYLEHREETHNIEVAWLEANTATDSSGDHFEHPAGWYWRDLDGELPEQWQGDPEARTHVSSRKALDHAKRNA